MIEETWKISRTQKKKNFFLSNNNWQTEDRISEAEERPEEFTQKQYKEKIDGKLWKGERNGIVGKV